MSNYIIDYLTDTSPSCLIKLASSAKKESVQDLEEVYQDALAEKELALKALAPSDSWWRRHLIDPFEDRVLDKDVYKKLVSMPASISEAENQKAIEELSGLSNPESLRLARVLTNIARIEDMKQGKKKRELLALRSRMEDPSLLQQKALNRQSRDMAMHALMPRTVLVN